MENKRELETRRGAISISFYCEPHMYVLRPPRNLCQRQGVRPPSISLTLARPGALGSVDVPLLHVSRLNAAFHLQGKKTRFDFGYRQ